MICFSDSEAASSHQSTSGSTYYSPPSSASQYRSNSDSQGQQRQAAYSGTFSPYLPAPSRTTTHQSLSSNRDYSNNQLFSNVDSRFTSTGTDLRDIMSETQRMANLQRNQISTGSSNRYGSSTDVNRQVYKTAADLDAASADFVRSGSLASRSEFDADRNVVPVAPNGGYQKIKSWSRQSQWSSGEMENAFLRYV